MGRERWRAGMNGKGDLEEGWGKLFKTIIARDFSSSSKCTNIVGQPGYTGTGVRRGPGGGKHTRSRYSHPSSSGRVTVMGMNTAATYSLAAVRGALWRRGGGRKENLG